MPIDGKYGVITAEHKNFHPGEPVFLLRATDKFAPAAIFDYAVMCRACGCSEEHVAAIYAHGNRMKQWQSDNPTLVKTPD